MKIPLLIAGAGLVVCATVSAGPSRDELSAMLQSPTSDWSSMFTHLDHHGASAEECQYFRDERATLRTLAALDAKTYAQERPTGTEESANLMKGEQHALKHNLIGYVVSEYAVEFSKVLEVISDRNTPSGTLDAVLPP
jgi:hypothetical protein